ncbi:CLUMA_CG011257, isoform A [Clunio marinus]|uniref:CLUMA_CG011257, isoform A n=1 Tax=Clunio marinus TaxID=568069 RepID=A0A1J1IDP6_9DIPT|nr:CLUMA_CG011257, isoform A [Clunio marinus]
MAENMNNDSNNSDDNKKVYNEFRKMIAEAKFSPNMDKILLERYLKVSDNNLVNAFALLKHGLELRQKASYLFFNRDLSVKEIQTAFTTFQFCPLRKLTKEKYKITIIRFPKCDANLYDSVDVIKTALMMFDACYTMYDNGDDLIEGEIFILDVVGFSFKQFLNLSKNVNTFLHYTKFLQEAAPVRLISNHITNTSSIMDGVLGLVKPILRKELQDLVHFHKVGSDTMLKFFEKDVLPIDYGGTNGTIDEHYKEWLKVFETKRDYLLNDDYWKISTDET